MTTEAELRAQLARTGTRVSEREWRWLRDERLVASALDPREPENVNTIARRVQQLRRTFGGSPRRRRNTDGSSESPTHSGSTQESTYGLWAAERSARIRKMAAGDAMFSSLQGAVLRGPLVAPAALFDWLVRHRLEPECSLEGVARYFSADALTIAVPASGMHFEHDSIPFRPDVWLNPYAIDIDLGPVYVIKRPQRSPQRYDALMEACLYATRRFAWHLAEAASYVLFEWQPTVHMMRFTRSGGLALNSQRVSLDIDASTTPDQLLRFYKDARQSVPHRARKGPTEKQSVLAFFSRAYRNMDAGPAAHMRRWNGIWPDWRYESLANFQRDMKAAEASVAP